MPLHTYQLKQNASPSALPLINTHMDAWYGCTLCERHPLCAAYCFYRGHVPAQVLFIGEAPGDSENIFGRPFMGPAGECLQEIIEAIVPPWIDYAITNVVCCAPYDENGDTRPPNFSERMACQPRLHEFATICNPKLIVGVGNPGYDAGVNLVSNVTKKARLCRIKHPSWILRQEDRVLETQRAILELKQGLTDVRILRPTTQA